MSEINPHYTDAVLGGQNPPLFDAAILGGLAGVEQRLTSESLAAKLQALINIINYGNKGINLAIQALADSNEDIRRLARRLLRDRLGDEGKEALLEREPSGYFTTFDDWRQEIYDPLASLVRAI